MAKISYFDEKCSFTHQETTKIHARRSTARFTIVKLVKAKDEEQNLEISKRK